MMRALATLAAFGAAALMVVCSASANDESESTDARWSARDKRLLSTLTIAGTKLPEEPSNRWADDARAAALGKRLFFDKRLSGNGELSCASCHQPERYFTDGKERAVGVHKTGRNTPTIVGSAYSEWFYWDGRRDTLWSQALVPFEAADEMGGSRAAIIRIVSEDPTYRVPYEAIFGPLPERLAGAELPPQAGPLGSKETSKAWFKLPREIQNDINAVYANLGKAIAAYERTVNPEPTAFDRYVESVLAGDDEAAAKYPLEAVRGLRLFINDERTQCLRCHNGAMFTNGGFHNIGTGGMSGGNLDFGRLFGVQAVVLDEFNCLGPYSDAPTEACMELRFLPRDAHAPLRGAFKTPGLRGLTHTGPFFHDGRHATLQEVLSHYNEPPAENGPNGGHELLPMGLDQEELESIAAFLRTLSN